MLKNNIKTLKSKTISLKKKFKNSFKDAQKLLAKTENDELKSKREMENLLNVWLFIKYAFAFDQTF